MNLIKNLKQYVDFKLTILLAAFYSICVLIHFWKMYYAFHMGWTRIKPVPLDLYLIDWIVIVGYFQIIAIATKKYISTNLKWKMMFIIHLVFSILIGALLQIVADIYRFSIGAIPDVNFERSFKNFIYFLDLNFLIYFAMLAIIYVFYYWKIIRASEQQHQALKIQLNNTRIGMLRSQLQPHFLFNTLNCISSLIEVDKEKAQDTLVDLSEFFRETLDTKDSQLITVQREMETLHHYLNILAIRFSDQILVEENIEPSVLDEKIPALLLQPIIENSIKYGYSYEHPKLKIIITIRSQFSYIEIIVENNGKLLEGTSKRRGVGLENIRERLQEIYGSDHFFAVRNKEDGSGVENIFRIPKKPLSPFNFPQEKEL